MYCRHSVQVLVHAVVASEIRRWQVLEDLEIYFVRELVKQGILPLEKVVWMKRAGYWANAVSGRHAIVPEVSGRYRASMLHLDLLLAHWLLSK